MDKSHVRVVYLRKRFYLNEEHHFLADITRCKETASLRQVEATDVHNVVASELQIFLL